MSISTILTQYKRPHLHELQVESIKSQSIPCSEIFCWVNSCDHSFVRVEGVSYICCDNNWKFHGRFALALLCQNPIVAVFDDDIVPGKHWFKNCMEHVDRGILGSSGVALPSSGYTPNAKYGHLGIHNERLVEVDLVGHSWFMKKEFVRYMFSEEPYSWNNAEDIQLAAIAKSKGKVGSFVPPHPVGQEELWGCLPQYNGLGNDWVATSVRSNHYELRSQAVEFYKEKGWEVLCRKMKN